MRRCAAHASRSARGRAAVELLLTQRRDPRHADRWPASWRRRPACSRSGIARRGTRSRTGLERDVEIGLVAQQPDSFLWSCPACTGSHGSELAYSW